MIIKIVNDFFTVLSLSPSVDKPLTSEPREIFTAEQDLAVSTALNEMT